MRALVASRCKIALVRDCGNNTVFLTGWRLPCDHPFRMGSGLSIYESVAFPGIPPDGHRFPIEDAGVYVGSPSEHIFLFGPRYSPITDHRIILHFTVYSSQGLYTKPPMQLNNSTIKTKHRIRRPPDSIVIFPLRWFDILLLQLGHMCKTRSLVYFLDQVLHG